VDSSRPSLVDIVFRPTANSVYTAGAEFKAQELLYRP
jgi:hypothetical protein